MGFHQAAQCEGILGALISVDESVESLISRPPLGRGGCLCLLKADLEILIGRSVWAREVKQVGIHHLPSWGRSGRWASKEMKGLDVLLLCVFLCDIRSGRCMRL